MPTSLPDENTIFAVCSYLRNFFDKNQPHFYGNVTITNGALSQTYGLKVGQYFRLVGSSLNDGVYKYPVTTLTDEEFNGAIIGMAIPNAVLQIMKGIEDWDATYGAADSMAMSPFTSESIPNVYSYSKGVGGADTSKDMSGTAIGVYAAKLAPWRKI